MRIPSALAMLAIGAFALSGCSAGSPAPGSADRAGARIGQLAAELAGRTEGHWQYDGLKVNAWSCKLDDGSQGITWYVNAVQVGATYHFADGDETAEQIGIGYGDLLSEYGYEVEVDVEMQPGDQEQIIITGHTADPDDGRIEFHYAFYPFDEVGTTIFIRSECLEGDRDDYPTP